MQPDDARQNEERITQRRASVLGIAYFDTSVDTQKPLYPELLPVPELKQLRVVPMRMGEGFIDFGVTTTTSQQTMALLRQHFSDYRCTFSLISDNGFKDYMLLYDPPKQVVYQDISVTTSDVEDLVSQVSQTLEQVRSDDTLAYLVKQAHRLNASDIHLENEKDFTRVRFRIDGVLHTIARLSPEKTRTLLSVIASAGNVSTGELEPQQGHIVQDTVMADGATVVINIRLETVPTLYGMDVVMRLFNLDQNMFTLDRLGLSPQERTIVDGIISKPSGLVLAVGPTGSGKTTTLYSILNSLNSDSRKIITLEDPVEYQFSGITQVPVRSKTSAEVGFADKLRAVLRLDPDIIMVGEIRDMDTAKTALQASLTGHLVLSTFHASSASAALTRLMDVIGENPLFLSAIRLVMAQRLVRRLDDSLKQPYTPDEKMLRKLQEIIDSFPPGLEHPTLDGIQLYRPGSSPDNPFGYSGQIALREQFVMNDEIINVLSEEHHRFTTQEIETAAIKAGMVTMLQDGVLKVLRGETSPDDLFRVLG